MALGGCVPVGAGLTGALLGQDILGSGSAAAAPADGHVRYLSGLLFAIGLAFWSCIPRILEKGPRFRLLTAIVVAGGAARLYGFVLDPVPAPDTLFPLAMELAVTPLLALWRERLAASSGDVSRGSAGRS